MFPSFSPLSFRLPPTHPPTHPRRLARERAHLPIQSDYDILFTTGPDVVSTVVNRRQYADVVIIRDSEAALGFQHLVTGGWRDQALEWHHPGWDAWLQSGKLGTWRPQWA